jgi:hypothetical protein
MTRLYSGRISTSIELARSWFILLFCSISFIACSTQQASFIEVDIYNDLPYPVTVAECAPWVNINVGQINKIKAIAHACSVFGPPERALFSTAPGKFNGCLIIPMAVDEVKAIVISSLDNNLSRKDCIKLADRTPVHQ